MYKKTPHPNLLDKLTWSLEVPGSPFKSRFILMLISILLLYKPADVKSQQVNLWCLEFEAYDINGVTPNQVYYSDINQGLNELSTCDEVTLEFNTAFCRVPAKGAADDKYQLVYLKSTTPNPVAPAIGTALPQTNGPWSSIINIPVFDFNSTNFPTTLNGQTFTYAFNQSGSHSIIAVIAERDGNGILRVANVSASNAPPEAVMSGILAVNYLNDSDPIVIAGLQNLCSGTLTQTYSISSSLNGLNINWTVTGGTILAGQGSPSVDIQWNANSYGTISVVADNGECQLYGNYEVFGCCVPEPTVSVVVVDQKLSETILSGLGNLDFPNNLGIWYIAVNGTFEIDESFDFRNIGFHMGPLAKITFGDGVTVNFNNANFRSECGYMWDKIALTTGSIVRFDTCGIFNAIHGIYSTVGAGATVNFCTFQWNYRGISILNDNPASGHFYSNTNKVKTTGNYFTDGVINLPPYNGVRPNAGIYIKDVAFAQIGENGSLTNYFGNVTPSPIFAPYPNHVISINSNLRIENSDFTNAQVYGSPSNCASIYADATVRGQWDNWEMNLVIDGSVRRNNFDKHYRAVFARGLDRVRILGNNFDNSGTNIESLNTRLQLEVKFNEINIGLSNSSTTTLSSVGVLATQTQPRSLTASISFNKIEGCNNGIYLINQNATSITANEITLKSAPYFWQSTYRSGIRVENSHNTTIYQNILEHEQAFLNTDNTADKLRGITLSNCLNNFVGDNEIRRFGSGIFGASNLTSTQFYCNFLETNRYGFNFLNFYLTNQGSLDAPSDNRWVTTMGPHRIYGQGAQNTFPTTPIWYHRTGSIYNPQPTNLSLIELDPLPSNQAPLNCWYIPKGDDDPIDPEEEANYRELAVGEIVADQNVYTNSVYEYQSETFAFRYLEAEQNHTLGVNSDPAFQQYYQQRLGSNFEKVLQLYKVAYAGNADSLSSLAVAFTPINTLENHIKEVSHIYAKSWAKGKYLLDSAQRAYLEPLAASDPDVLGEAVYTARVMVGWHRDETGSQYRQTQEVILPSTDIKIYPNPADDLVYIESESFDPSSLSQTEIFDLNGRRVLQADNYFTEGRWQINVKTLPSGIYSLRFSTEDGICRTVKLIKK